MGFFDTLFGGDSADAAREASNLKYLNQSRAAGNLADVGRKYASAWDELSGRYDPYVNSGNAALERLLTGLGLPGGDGADFAASYRALPGYQAGLDAGVSALDRSAAARGMTNSGRQLKALQRYGSDYEDQRSGNYLTRLASLSTQGLGATGAQVGAVGTGLQGQLGADTAAANMMYNAAGTVPEGIIAAQNAHNAGAQNAINLGTTALGMLMGNPGFGGGGSSFAGQSSFGGPSGNWIDPDSSLGGLRRLFG